MRRPGCIVTWSSFLCDDKNAQKYHIKVKWMIDRRDSLKNPHFRDIKRSLRKAKRKAKA